jgi:signal transduction histidine kinase
VADVARLNLRVAAQELELSEISIREIVNDTLDSLAIANDMRLSLTIDPDMPPSTGDAPQLVRVFQSLVNNGLDAIYSGGRLTINARQDGDSIKTVVSDTGCGISPQALKGILEPLCTTKAKGTGLGLAVCQEIVKKHHGSISVESEVGAGTSFTVPIPVAP